MLVTNINQCIHEQAPVCHCLIFIQQASLYLPYNSHSYKKQKKRNKHSLLLFLSKQKKELRTQHRRCITLKKQKKHQACLNVHLIFNVSFCSYVLMSLNKNYYLASIRDLPSAKARFN